MIVEFLLEANYELAEAAGRYDAENPGVGIEFISELRHAVELIADINDKRRGCLSAPSVPDARESVLKWRGRTARRPLCL